MKLRRWRTIAEIDYSHAWAQRLTFVVSYTSHVRSLPASQVRGSAVAKSIAAGLLLGATLVGVSRPASATPYAFASVQVSNFALAINNGGNFSVNSNSSTSANTAVYGTMSSALPEDRENAPSTANQSEAAAGPGPFPGQDVYTSNAGRVQGMNGSRSDSVALSGNGSAVAESQLFNGTSGRAIGSGSTSVSVTLGAAGTISFSFTASAFAEASTTATNDAANATTMVSDTIADGFGTILFTYSPTALNFTVASSSGLPPSDVTLNRTSATYSSPSQQLAAGTYTISTSERSMVIVTGASATTPVPTSVPEPASLTLLGLGVAGIAAVRRRRAG